MRVWLVFSSCDFIFEPKSASHGWWWYDTIRYTLLSPRGKFVLDSIWSKLATKQNKNNTLNIHILHMPHDCTHHTLRLIHFLEGRLHLHWLFSGCLLWCCSHFVWKCARSKTCQGNFKIKVSLANDYMYRCLVHVFILDRCYWLLDNWINVDRCIVTPL